MTNMKYYATIEGTAQTQKIYVEGKSFFVRTSDCITEHYGDPEKYIQKVLKGAEQLNRKVVIKR